MSGQPALSLIGAPTDVGTSVRGASMGPEALRVAELAAALRACGADVICRGDLDGPAHAPSTLATVHRNLDAVVEWNRWVHDAVLAELQCARMPVLLGGDHSLSIGSISAVARHCRALRRRLRVIWLDAHADFNTSAISPSGNLHGMPVAVLCGLGPRVLTALGGRSPAIEPGWLRQIGIRSVDAGERHLLHEHRIEVYDMRHVEEFGMRSTMALALADLGPDTHLHVSFDVDFLDPGFAPGVGTAVQGGPSYREAQLCMEMIADTGRLGSLDVMELNPACDVRNATARIVVELLQSLFGRSTLLRRTPARFEGAATPVLGGPWLVSASTCATH